MNNFGKVARKKNRMYEQLKSDQPEYPRVAGQVFAIYFKYSDRHALANSVNPDRTLFAIALTVGKTIGKKRRIQLVCYELKMSKYRIYRMY